MASYAELNILILGSSLWLIIRKISYYITNKSQFIWLQNQTWVHFLVLFFCMLAGRGGRLFWKFNRNFWMTLQIWIVEVFLPTWAPLLSLPQHYPEESSCQISLQNYSWLQLKVLFLPLEKNFQWSCCKAFSLCMRAANNLGSYCFELT